MRIALGIEYDGATFTGWQTQTGGRGVQDAVEGALSQIAGSAIATICAGRTDSGVHALDQVVHFDTDATRPLTAWVRGVNRFLAGVSCGSVGAIRRRELSRSLRCTPPTLRLLDLECAGTIAAGTCTRRLGFSTA